MNLFIRLFVCIVAASWTLYAYIHRQNELVLLRLTIPVLSKEVKAIQETNIELEYEIERFESPIHLMELAKKPEFSHLKSPFVNEITQISHKISRQVGQDVASGLLSNEREHCQTDKASEFECKDDATDCPNCPRVCEKSGLRVIPEP